MDKTSLAEFTSFLLSLKPQSLTTGAVDDFLEQRRFETRDFFPFAHFSRESYARNLILKTDMWELLLLTWLPNQRTPIHDHGGSRCWMVVQSGSLCLKNFKPAPQDDSPLVCVEGARDFHAGSADYIDDELGVHSITNRASEPAVSLHLYSPPVPHCRVYDEGSQRFHRVELSYYTTPSAIPARKRPFEPSLQS